MVGNRLCQLPVMVLSGGISIFLGSLGVFGGIAEGEEDNNYHLRIRIVQRDNYGTHERNSNNLHVARKRRSSLLGWFPLFLF